MCVYITRHYIVHKVKCSTHSHINIECIPYNVIVYAVYIQYIYKLQLIQIFTTIPYALGPDNFRYVITIHVT